MKYLHKNKINAYISDNLFRVRDPMFTDHKKKHPRASKAKKESTKTFSLEDFIIYSMNMTCICPNGETLGTCGIFEDYKDNKSARFEGRLSQCRNCPLKQQCMKNPQSTDHCRGRGRQVYFYSKYRINRHILIG